MEVLNNVHCALSVAQGWLVDFPLGLYATMALYFVVAFFLYLT